MADWQATAPSSDKAYGHWPKGAILEPAQSPFEWAQQAIPPVARPIFNGIVLHGRSAGKWAPAFKAMASRLLEHIEAEIELGGKLLTSE